LVTGPGAAQSEAATKRKDVAVKGKKGLDRRGFLIRSAKGIGLVVAGMPLLNPDRRVFVSDGKAKALAYVPYRETPHILKYYETL